MGVPRASGLVLKELESNSLPKVARVLRNLSPSARRAAQIYRFGKELYPLVSFLMLRGLRWALETHSRVRGGRNASY